MEMIRRDNSLDILRRQIYKAEMELQSLATIAETPVEAVRGERKLWFDASQCKSNKICTDKDGSILDLPLHERIRYAQLIPDLIANYREKVETGENELADELDTVVVDIEQALFGRS